MATWNRKIEIIKPRNRKEYLGCRKSQVNANPPPVPGHDPRTDTGPTISTYKKDRGKNGAKIKYHSMRNEVVLTGIRMKRGSRPSALTVNPVSKTLLELTSKGEEGTDWKYYVQGYYMDEKNKKVELETKDPRIRNRGQ